MILYMHYNRHYLCVGVAAPTELITASSPGAEHAISSGSGQVVERKGGVVAGEGGGVEGEGGEVEGEGGGEVAGESGGVEGEGGGVEGEGGGGVEGEGGGGVEGEGGGVEGEGGGVEGGGGEMAQQPSELHTERQRSMCVCVFWIRKQLASALAFIVDDCHPAHHW